MSLEDYLIPGEEIRFQSGNNTWLYIFFLLVYHRTRNLALFCKSFCGCTIFYYWRIRYITYFHIHTIQMSMVCPLNSETELSYRVRYIQRSELNGGPEEPWQNAEDGKLRRNLWSLRKSGRVERWLKYAGNIP